MMKKIIVGFSLSTLLLISGVFLKPTNQVALDEPIHPKIVNQVASDDPIHPKAHHNKQTKWI